MHARILAVSLYSRHIEVLGITFNSNFDEALRHVNSDSLALQIMTTDASDNLANRFYQRTSFKGTDGGGCCDTMLMLHFIHEYSDIRSSGVKRL